MNRIDLRSDTVTLPSDAMRSAMASAPVGDDQYGEDPTVRALQERVAALLGKEAAVFVPSGTMANQIGLKLLTRPGDDVVVGDEAHVVWHESGAAGAHAGVEFRVGGCGGLFNTSVASGTSLAELAAPFDVVSVALSKGLGCPVGSLIAGSAADMVRAVRARRMFGGAMRQSGILAAAGLYALAHNLAPPA